LSIDDDFRETHFASIQQGKDSLSTGSRIEVTEAGESAINFLRVCPTPLGIPLYLKIDFTGK